MSLQFVTGSSGSGKSQYLYQEVLRESAEHPEKQYLVIVPEQFTMQTQKEILQKSPRHGLLNVDVLSFHRLAWRVFEETGGDRRPVLEDTGKTLVVQRVISARKNKLQVLGKSLARQGAVEEMKSLISELMQYRVKPQDLSGWTEQGGSYFSAKIQDIQEIYQGFQEYLQEHYLTVEEIPEILCGVIGRSSLVRDSVVVLDGFTGFTPSQYQIVRELLSLAEKVMVAVTLDGREDPWQTGGMHQLFYMSKVMLKKTAELAREAHVEILPVIRLDGKETGRFSGNPELAFLEQNLFRYSGRQYRSALSSEPLQKEKEAGQNPEHVPDKMPLSGPKNIRLAEASDPTQEMTCVAEEICRMVRENGYHFRDFAVVTGDLPAYGGEADRIFTAAGIPHFVDQNKSVLNNQLVECIRAVLDMMIRNYSYESVFRYLRSGLSDFTPEETDLLENYVLAEGIRGFKMYREPFTSRPKLDQEDRMLLYNQLREKFLGEIRELHEGLHRRMGTAGEKAEALYRFLTKLRCQEKIQKAGEAFRDSREPLLEKEYSQIWELVMNLLDKIVEVLGEEPMKLEDFRDILETGFQEGTVGLIPPGEDQVLVGDLERTRLRRIRVLFFVGVNEGIVPKAVSSGGLLSETDREELKKRKVELSPTAREEIYQQRFYLYLVMTKPQDMLCISCSRSSRDGKAQMPSYLIGTVKRLFPDLQMQDLDADRPVPARLETPEGRKQLLFEGLSFLREGRTPAGFLGLTDWMRESPQGKKELDRLLLAARAYRRDTGIGKKMAELLYGTTLQNSVTRLEEFAGCPYRHFLDYGLQLRERETFAFTAVDFGTILHEALERFTRNLEKAGKDWASLSDAERTALADAALEDVLGSHSTLLYSTARNTAMVHRMQTTLGMTVWALQEQLKAGEFRTAAAESVFSGNLPGMHYILDSGTDMKLTGRIDRVDTCVKDGTCYLKILDYKTGDMRLDLTSLYYGLQLQLAVYMRAVLERARQRHPEEKAEPGALFYYHIQEPFLELKQPGEEKNELLEALRPNGLLRSEDQILQLFEKNPGPGASLVLPVSRKKDGSLRKGSGAASGEEMRTVLDYTGREVQKLGQEMMQGDTGVRPVKLAARDACGFCPYQAVCRFEERMGDSYRLIRKEEPDAILIKMKKDLEQEGGQA